MRHLFVVAVPRAGGGSSIYSEARSRGSILARGYAEIKKKYPGGATNRLTSSISPIHPESTWIGKWEMPIRQEPGNRGGTPDGAVGSLGHLGLLVPPH